MSFVLECAKMLFTVLPPILELIIEWGLHIAETKEEFLFEEK